MKEKIKAIKEYLKYFPDDFNAKKNLLLCEYANELDIELTNSYYPRIECDYFIINSHIKVGKNYNLTNSETNYKPNKKDNIIIWHVPSGRLTFVDRDYYDDVDSEWREFKEVLKSYNPLDYDEINDTYLYELENGKRLIDDYDEIVQNFKNKVNKKIKEVQIKNKKKEIERLQKELEEN
ncbi:MAG: hypothetical protein IJO27_00420 [Bacilli bacterium]|nr:hypothetical protein [Bacilli bacterium]